MLARLVRVVAGGVAHHVEGALGPIALQGLRQHQGQRLATEVVGVRGEAAGPVVKGHGADPLLRGHLLDAADRGEVDRRPRPDLVLKVMLGLFGKADAFGDE